MNNDLKEEIICRIEYYKQLCKDRQFIDQEMYHFYRGSASSLNILLSYMERGITDYTETSEDTAKKILESKELKGRYLSEAMKMEVKKPDGSRYCNFSVNDDMFIIELNSGYKVLLDRKVIPDLKKFLNSL